MTHFVHRTASRARELSLPPPPPSSVTALCLAVALKLHSDMLTPYEQGEILEYPQVYFLGPNAKKVRGQPQAPNNCGPQLPAPALGPSCWVPPSFLSLSLSPAPPALLLPFGQTDRGSGLGPRSARSSTAERLFSSPLALGCEMAHNLSPRRRAQVMTTSAATTTSYCTTISPTATRSWTRAARAPLARSAMASEPPVLRERVCVWDAWLRGILRNMASEEG